MCCERLASLAVPLLPLQRLCESAALAPSLEMGMGFLVERVLARKDILTA